MKKRWAETLATLVALLFIVTPPTLLAYQAPAGYETTTAPFFRFHHLPQDEKTAGKLANEAGDIRKRLTADLGIVRPGMVHVVLAGSADDYNRLQPRAKIRPEWSVGVAYPSRGLIFLHDPAAAIEKNIRADLTQVFTHELVHVYLAEALAPADPPRWLQEGYAKWRAGEMSITDITTMTWAYMAGGLIPLEELVHRFPEPEGRARLAYAESVSFVSFLFHELGPNGFHTFLARLRATGDADEALLRTSGKSLADLESEWLTYIALHFTVLRVLADPAALWAVGGILIVFGWLRIRRRQKRRLAEMEREEAMYYGYTSGTHPDDTKKKYLN